MTNASFCVSICTFALENQGGKNEHLTPLSPLPRLLPGAQRLRCQYLYFLTSKASKLSSLAWRAAPHVSVFVLGY